MSKEIETADEYVKLAEKDMAYRSPHGMNILGTCDKHGPGSLAA
jgi:hypothetical protein